VTVDDLLLLLTDNSMLKKESSNQPPIYDQTYFKLRKLGDPKVLLTLNESSKTQAVEIYTWEKNTHTQFTVHKVASWCWGDAGQLKKVLICSLCERSHENETQKPKGKLSQSWLGTGHIQSSSVRYSAWRQRTISSLLVSQPSSIYQES
jgi:hypothetical protein